jgi:hypothetical protein
MLKKISLALIFCAPFSLYAQKETKDPLVIQLSISPSQPAPAQQVTYTSAIETPINPLTYGETKSATEGKTGDKQAEALNAAKQAKLAAWANQKLAISAGKISFSPQNPDWRIKLTTSDVNVTATNDKPIGELSNQDYVFKYTYTATITVADRSGSVVYQTEVVGSGKEQEMPKAVFFLNPLYKMRLAMVKNNPEKTKKIVDEMMESKNAILLEYIVDQAGAALKDAYEIQVKTINLSLFSVKGKAYDEIATVNEKFTDVYGKFRAFSKKNRVPKENVDQVLREAIPVWEKYAANNPELEEKARKGLLLNCAVGAAWLGDYQKGSECLSKVPEATMPDTSPDDEENAPSPGTTIILSFVQSAENAFLFHNLMQQHKERAVIVQ